MHKYLIIIVLGIIAASLTACSIKTPEIRGVVLDEETKQPVEEAWITATLGIKTKTVAGNVHKYLSVETPHTRTDKSGKFIIPTGSFKKPSFPIGFGTDVETFGVGASTVDDKGGSLSLMEFLGKKKADITIYVKPDHTKDTEGEYFTYLQGLYNYCLTGRFYVEVPPVEGGCDQWELGYAIAKHEKYLDRYRDPKTIENPPYGVSKFERIIHYSGIIQQSAYLNKKRGDNNQALRLFKEVKDFDNKHELSLHLAEYEHQINELQKLIREKQK